MHCCANPQSNHVPRYKMIGGALIIICFILWIPMLHALVRIVQRRKAPAMVSHVILLFYSSATAACISVYCATHESAAFHMFLCGLLFAVFSKSLAITQEVSCSIEGQRLSSPLQITAHEMASTPAGSGGGWTMFRWILQMFLVVGWGSITRASRPQPSSSIGPKSRNTAKYICPGLFWRGYIESNTSYFAIRFLFHAFVFRLSMLVGSWLSSCKISPSSSLPVAGITLLAVPAACIWIACRGSSLYAAMALMEDLICLFIVLFGAYTHLTTAPNQTAQLVSGYLLEKPAIVVEVPFGLFCPAGSCFTIGILKCGEPRHQYTTDVQQRDVD